MAPGRGRPVGSANKRKADSELSQNQATKRCRNWRQSKTMEEQDLMRANETLQQAIRRALKRLKQGDEWQNSDPEKRERLEEQARTACNHKAYVKGNHPEQVKMKLNVSSAQQDALGLIEDDGDEDWEDIDADEEGFDEEDRIRQEVYDAVKNDEPLDFNMELNFDQAMHTLRENQYLVCVKQSFKVFKRLALDLIEDLNEKLRQYDLHPDKYLECFLDELGLEDLKTVRITALDVFSEAEIVVWKYLGLLVKAPKLSPTKAAKRIIRCWTMGRGKNYKILSNYGGKRRPRKLEPGAPTLAGRIRRIRYLPLGAKLREPTSVWETLPGPAFL
ncbi:hypothetical protein GGI35DRAFT_108903 [Trichoderma velutinum]